MMKLKKLGKPTSSINVEASEHGIWLFVEDKEYFLPYKEYPWFKNAKPSQLHNVKLLFGNHLHWPHLDVDLELKSLEQPEKYPLRYKEKETIFLNF